MISTATATQVYKAVSPVIRKNMTHPFIYRLRNQADLQAVIEEMSAVYGPKTLLQRYHEAVSGPYSFFYINLTQRDKSKCFLNGSIDHGYQIKKQVL